MQDRFRGVADEDMMITAVFVECDASRYACVALNFLFDSDLEIVVYSL